MLMGSFFFTSRYSFIEWRHPSGAVARQRLARGVNDLKSSSFRWFRPRLKKVEETENKDDDDNGDNIHNNDNNGGDDDSNDDEGTKQRQAYFKLEKTDSHCHKDEQAKTRGWWPFPESSGHFSKEKVFN